MEARVGSLWRYPASSLAGETLAAADIGPAGIDGDRLFGIVDAATGEIASPAGIDRRWRPVPRIAARLSPDDRLEVAVPGGRWRAAPGEEADRAVSGFLGFAARIRPLAGERHAGSGGPLAHARYARAPVHLLTTASLARLKALYPDAQADLRRFRPNIVVDMPPVEGSFPETEWTGRRIAVGEAELLVAKPCRRCGFTTLAQEDLDEDPEILRRIVRHNGHDLGIYCTVVRPGRVAVGDAVGFSD